MYSILSIIRKNRSFNLLKMRKSKLYLSGVTLKISRGVIVPTPPPSSLSNFPTLPQSSPLTMNNLSGGKKKFNKLLITATAGLDWTKDVLVAV